VQNKKEAILQKLLLSIVDDIFIHTYILTFLYDYDDETTIGMQCRNQYSTSATPEPIVFPKLSI